MEISRPTSVAANPAPSFMPVTADAVIVFADPLVALGVNVVVVIFSVW